MKKQVIILACVLICLIAQTAVAVENPWYLGIGAGQASLDTGVSGLTGSASLDDKDTAFKGIAGYQFNKYIAVEANYTDLGETTLKGNTGDTFNSGNNTYVFTADNVNISTDSKSYGLSAILGYPLHQYFTPFVKLGGQFWDTDATVSSDAGNADGNDDGTSFLLGAGIRADIHERVAIRAEYERYDIDDDVDLLSAAILFKF